MMDYVDMLDDPDLSVANISESIRGESGNGGLIQPESQLRKFRSRNICAISACVRRRFGKRQAQLESGAQRVKKGSMYSKGTPDERAAWSLRLQAKKLEKKIRLSECGVLELLTSLGRVGKLTSGLKISCSKRGALFSQKGLVTKSIVKASTKGNRFVSTYTMTDFLETSFGKLTSRQRIKQRNAQAIASEMARGTVTTMQTAVACAVMARQARMLANIYKLCRTSPPTVYALREAFDETGQSVTVNFGFGNEKTVSQICVIHHYMLLCWLDLDGVEKRLSFPLVLPPLLVLSPSAPQLYYATTNHPMLHTVWSLERLIANTAEEVILLQETDSATANDRLYHFKLQRFDDHDNALRECMPCLSHQVAGP